MDYKKELLRRKMAYYNKLGDATPEDKLNAMATDTSVAAEERRAFIELDYSIFYNSGIKPESLPYKKDQKNYMEFMRAFELDAPTGKPPKKAFHLPNDLG